MNKFSFDENYGKVIIVVGMQYGSEGKGAITEYLSPAVGVGVRTGASNAGHTIYFNEQKFVMHQIPSLWINPLAKLVIGVGAIINLDVLLHEIDQIEKIFPIKHRLFIDKRALIVTKQQIKKEGETNLANRIGSTSAKSSKGIGVAMADKVSRDESCVHAEDIPEIKKYLADTVDLINTSLDDDQIVLLEGTQGFHLGLDYGRFPFVTSRNTDATAIAASAGIATHNFDVDVVGVTRTYPIRVSGNSGPFGDDSKEVCWDYVSRKSGAKRHGHKIIERTSVTKAVRRVATFSMSDFEKAVRVNRPTEIAVTFSDYLDWDIHERKEVSPPIENFMELLEDVGGVPVSLIKTGPRTVLDYNPYRNNLLRRIK